MKRDPMAAALRSAAEKYPDAFITADEGRDGKKHLCVHRDNGDGPQCHGRAETWSEVMRLVAAAADKETT